jgi:hypothetical protein
MDFGSRSESNRHHVQLSHLELAVNLGVTNGYQFISPLKRHQITDTVFVDTVAHSSSGYLSFDSTTADTSTVFIQQKSTLTAVLLSAVIPGGGQIYNGSYWKVPIIYGLQGFFVYEWIQNNNLYKSFRTQLEDTLRVNPKSDFIGTLQGIRDSYHDQRDSYAWYMAGVYVLSVLDAYIDAELSGFDVSPSLGFAPDGSATAAVSFRVRF